MLNFLNGKEEAAAFVDKNYVKLHLSTLRKVYIFANILQISYHTKLKTNATWNDIYGYYPQAIIEFFQENWWITAIIGLIGFISAVAGIVTLFR